MKVRVKAYGGLNHFMPGKKEELELELPEGSNVDSLLDTLELPRIEVWMVSINKELVKGDHVLEDGDQVLIFAPVAGG